MTEQKSKIVIAASVAAVACAIYFLVPAVLNWTARALIRQDDLKPADVIIALGGDARCLREKMAAELYHKNLGSHVIVSGVPYGWGLNTGEAAKRYVVSLGVPDDKVIVFRES